MRYRKPIARTTRCFLAVVLLAGIVPAGTVFAREEAVPDGYAQDVCSEFARAFGEMQSLSDDLLTMAESPPGTDFIVKYRGAPQSSEESSADADRNGPLDGSEKTDSGGLPEPERGDVPFEVVSGGELLELARTGCLEWYEEDGEAVLLEDGYAGDQDSPAAGIAETVNSPAAETGDAPDASEESVSECPGTPEGAERARPMEEFGNITISYTEEQWNLAVVNAAGAAERNCLGQGIRVGVIDSGVSPHPDLEQQLQDGCSYINEAPDPEDTEDQYGHGTKVAGLIAASGENGQIGTAPMAEIVPLKCTDGKTVKISAICRAIYGGIDDYDCDVLNLSLGVQTDYQSMREAIAYAADKDVTVVSAVGNSGTSAIYYPANYSTVIGVGSVDSTESWYAHSNYNESVFVTAPGVDVRSTANDSGYSTGTGSSFAVPQVSGAAAVMLGADNTLTVAGVMRILSETARDKGAEGYDVYYGYGILDVGGCAETALAGSAGESDPEETNPEQKENPAGGDGGDSSGGGSDDPGEKPGDSETGSACTGDENCILRTYSDLDSGAWYHDSIHYVLERGIMNGYGNGLFGPGDGASRAMIVTMLWRADGSPEASESFAFTDADPGAWYAEALRWASEEDIVNGYDAYTFAPGDAVTREQFAAILHRYAIYHGSVDGAESGSENAEDVEIYLRKFPDSEAISSWALEDVLWSIRKGLFLGDEAGRLNPGGPVTRAQTAALLERFGV